MLLCHYFKQMSAFAMLIEEEGGKKWNNVTFT